MDRDKVNRNKVSGKTALSNIAKKTALSNMAKKTALSNIAKKAALSDMVKKIALSNMVKKIALSNMVKKIALSDIVNGKLVGKIKLSLARPLARPPAESPKKAVKVRQALLSLALVSLVCLACLPGVARLYRDSSAGSPGGGHEARETKSAGEMALWGDNLGDNLQEEVTQGGQEVLQGLREVCPFPFPGTPAPPLEEVIRFHVVAHSNQARDQEVKETLAGEILHYLEESLKRSGTRDRARENLGEEVPGLKIFSEEVLAREGTPYPVEIALDKKVFPSRQYIFGFFPAGEYEALSITVGEGQGDNWWCVLFPPLCFTHTPGQGAGLVLPGKEAGASPGTSPDPTPEIKFRVVEWARLMFP